MTPVAEIAALFWLASRFLQTRGSLPLVDWPLSFMSASMQLLLVLVLQLVYKRCS